MNYIISISKIIGDGEDGSVLLMPGPRSKLWERQARVSRSATLDGGAVIDHQGVSDGDRTFYISAANIEESVANRLLDMFENQTILTIATEKGFFRGSIDRLKIDGNSVICNFIVQE
jgi:hypothetical protein